MGESDLRGATPGGVPEDNSAGVDRFWLGQEGEVKIAVTDAFYKIVVH